MSTMLKQRTTKFLLIMMFIVIAAFAIAPQRASAYMTITSGSCNSLVNDAAGLFGSSYASVQNTAQNLQNATTGASIHVITTNNAWTVNSLVSLTRSKCLQLFNSSGHPKSNVILVVIGVRTSTTYAVALGTGSNYQISNNELSRIRTVMYSNMGSRLYSAAAIYALQQGFDQSSYDSLANRVDLHYHAAESHLQRELAVGTNSMDEEKQQVLGNRQVQDRLAARKAKLGMS